MSENNVTPLMERYCDEAKVSVSAAVVKGNPIITVKIVPKGDVGALTISCDFAATVQGGAMAGLHDILSKPPWKATT
jgi:hypothetical protein